MTEEERKAMEWLTECEVVKACLDALVALTKPATKTVEVWRVEYAEASPDGYIPGCETHDSAAEAESAARNFRLSIPAYECIRVTGPHQQEVPA